jgi:regulator of sirC expression with transglutaminase-like and TPR domain
LHGGHGRRALAGGAGISREAGITITDANLAALLRMLEDADEGLKESLMDQLARMSIADFERVREAADGTGHAQQQAISRAGVRRRYREFYSMWERAVRRPRPHLERGLILLGEAAGVVGVADVSARLDRLAEEVGNRLSGDRAFDVGLTVLAEVLGQVHGLRGNVDDYDCPDNAYLQAVLHTGQGIPISLCSVALLVGQRLELPVWGIGTPGHFLGFYGDPDLGSGTYFDAFDGFRRLTRGDVERVLSRYVDAVDPSMLKPVTEREILARSIRNMMSMHEKHGEHEHVAGLMIWHDALA